MRVLIIASSLLALAACGQFFEDLGPSETTAPEENLQEPEPVLPEEAAATETVLQMLPDWGAQYLGRPFAQAFTNENRNCMGSTYKVTLDGDVAHITGWSWERPAERAYDRLLSVGPDGIVNGAGTTVRDRPDVPLGTDGVVTDPHVGFDVFSTATSGRISIAAIGPETGDFCWIKHIDY